MAEKLWNLFCYRVYIKQDERHTSSSSWWFLILIDWLWSKYLSVVFFVCLFIWLNKHTFVLFFFVQQRLHENAFCYWWWLVMIFMQISSYNFHTNISYIYKMKKKQGWSFVISFLFEAYLNHVWYGYDDDDDHHYHYYDYLQILTNIANTNYM